MDEYELLSQLETHIERSYGIRVEHAYDHRLLRRFFSRLPSHAAEARTSPSDLMALKEWPPLELFRNDHVQREALRALRMRSHFETYLANLLIPVEIRSNHTGLTQKMFDSVVRGFFLHRHIRTSLRLPEIHEEFAAWLLFSLVSDRVLIVETDFSHERNMVFKYNVQPYSQNVLRTTHISSHDSLFFSKTIAATIKDRIYIGTHPEIENIFNRDIGRSDLENIDSESRLGPDSNAAFLVIAGRRRDYSCAYIFPLYSILNRQSVVLKQVQSLFDTFMDVLGNEAHYRIERNKHHSRLRHTIGVEVDHLQNNYDLIFKVRPTLLERFEGDRNTLNIEFAKVNALIHDLSKDVTKQFEIEFDIFGNRRSKRDEHFIRVRLSPHEFSQLIEGIVKGAGGKRHASHFLLELAHKADIEVASDSTLTICLTELFNNAVKYNVAGDRIRIRTRDRGEEIVMTISNVGPALSDQEAELVPLMGLRGLNSQRLVGEGSGQGLAAVFGILEDMGVDTDYRQHSLTKEQISRLRSGHGSKWVSALDLSMHTIELVLPRGLGER